MERIVRRSARNRNAINYRIDNRDREYVVVPRIRQARRQREDDDDQPVLQRRRLNVRPAVPSGLQNQRNEILREDRPPGHQMTVKIVSFKQQFLSVIYTSGGDYYYKKLGTFDPEIEEKTTQMIYDFAALFRYLSQNAVIRNLDWKNLLPDVRNAIGILDEVESILVPFTHDFLLGDQNFLLEENQELMPGQYEASIKLIIQNIEHIKFSEYLTKMCSKLLNTTETEREIEDHLKQVVDGLFIRQQITELQDVIKSPYQCFSCVKGFQCKLGALHHMRSKHKNYINLNQIENSSSPSTRQLREELEKWKLHHEDVHPNCEIE